MKAVLLQTRDLGTEVRHFDFEVPTVTDFQFEPGQFISVVKNVHGKEITRAYSIASPRMGNTFSLCLNRVDRGLISPFLFDLKLGDEIEIKEPMGYFTMRHPGHRALFIATGTGIAPFRSILLDHLPRTDLHVTLLFGTRYETGLLYAEEFRRLTRSYPHFLFHPTITRPEPDWTGKTGRVQQHLDELLPAEAERATLDIYICGLKEMVDDVRQELRQRSFDRKQIVYERYD